MVTAPPRTTIVRTRALTIYKCIRNNSESPIEARNRRLKIKQTEKRKTKINIWRLFEDSPREGTNKTKSPWKKNKTNREPEPETWPGRKKVSLHTAAGHCIACSFSMMSHLFVIQCPCLNTWQLTACRHFSSTYATSSTSSCTNKSINKKVPTFSCSAIAKGFT